MDNELSSTNFALIKSVLSLKCPQCRKSVMFKNKGLLVYRGTFKMHENCTNCGLKFEIEPGFWYGALWASYPLIIIVEFPFLLMALFATWGDHWTPLLAMIAAFLILWPLFIRLGRSMWIHAWVKYKPFSE